MKIRTVPPTSELFSRHDLVARHPTLLTEARIQWALRNRAHNGLEGAVFESRGSELVIHEPAFLAWYLGLSGRAKPRAARRKRVAGWYDPPSSMKKITAVALAADCPRLITTLDRAQPASCRG